MSPTIWYLGVQKRWTSQIIDSWIEKIMMHHQFLEFQTSSNKPRGEIIPGTSWNPKLKIRPWFSSRGWGYGWLKPLEDEPWRWSISGCWGIQCFDSLDIPQGGNLLSDFQDPSLVGKRYFVTLNFKPATWSCMMLHVWLCLLFEKHQQAPSHTIVHFRLLLSTFNIMIGVVAEFSCLFDW